MTTMEHVLGLAALSPAAIPAEARRFACFSLYDWMVCGVAGVDEPLAAILRGAMVEEGGTPVASVLGGAALPARAAAMPAL
jgi:2-methylcitrate dehydratase PrpD